MLSVRAVSNFRKGMKDFLELPYSLYRNDKNWVAPVRAVMKEKLNKKKGAFLRNCEAEFFVAYNDGKPVGRITAQVDPVYNENQNNSKGFFGFYESLNDIKIAEVLLEKAEYWLKERGCSSSIGPFNFNINDECGFQIEGFDRKPTVMMPYTKSYYPPIFEKLGYGTACTLLSFVMENVTETPEIVSKMSQRIRNRIGDVDIRKVDMKNLEKEAEIILDIYNDAWSDNWGFTPMTKLEIEELIKSLKMFADPRIIYFAYKNGEPAACLVAIPNLNEIVSKYRHGRATPCFLYDFLSKKNKLSSFRVIIMGVKSKFRKTGLDFLMYDEIFNDGLQTENYKHVEMGWILDHNSLMTSVLNRMGAKPLNKYVILEKNITG